MKKIIASLLVLIITMILFSKFIQFVELRPGVQFNDPILNLFSPINLTWPIFIMIYGAIFGALTIIYFHPEELVIFMYLVPLEPPAGMIVLKDPFVEFFGGTKTLTKDLFFSGHTASLTLLTLSVPKRFKWFFGTLTILVAISVLLQKIHYTIDVLVAPIISLCCYNWASRINKKLINE
jgi:membrane-associated phospholipid phosphatase